MPGTTGSFSHPLSRLTFPPESLFSRDTHIEEIESPVFFAEGLHTWHQKGTHPYAFRFDKQLKSREWSEIKDRLQPPPSGIRSSVPLGGLGTGTIEMRADGRLANWLIFNNSPGDGNKIHLDDAFFGIWAQEAGKKAHATLLRSAPLNDLPSVEQIGYTGAFPVSRLRFSDTRIPLDVQLYAYGIFDLNDVERSHTPAVVFSFILSNPTQSPIQASLLYNQPNHINGTYRTERGLVLSRTGSESVSGEMCLAFAPGNEMTSMVASDLEEIWETFANQGHLENRASLGLFEHGAAATSVLVEPGTSRTVTFILSWFFPNRVIAGSPVGNGYAARYTSASDVNSDVVSRLPEIWRSLRAWDTLLHASTLPSNLQNGLRNSLGQLFKTSFYSSDDRWRSWDSFSDPSLSSMEENLHRALPLLYLAPEMLTSLLRAYAAAQLPEGRIPASLGNGQRYGIDEHRSANRANAADNGATPIFFVLSYALFRTTGDEAFLKELWPNLRKALEWQLSITTTEGLPSNLPALSDWASYEQEALLFHDAVLHVSGLQSILKLAEAIDRSEEIGHLKELLSSALKTLQSEFATPDGYKHGVSVAESHLHNPKDGHLFTGLLWAHVLDLSGLFDASQIQSMLETIRRHHTPLLIPQNKKKNKDLAIHEQFMPAAALNWAALNVFSNQDANSSFEVLNEFHQYQNVTLSDPWGYFEYLSFKDQLPHSNPNHASHLAIWFMIPALTGQSYDASLKKLSFSPLIKKGARLPFFLPGAKGIISAQKSDSFVLHVISGRLELKQLEIGPKILYRDILLEEGQMIELIPRR